MADIDPYDMNDPRNKHLYFPGLPGAGRGLGWHFLARCEREIGRKPWDFTWGRDVTRLQFDPPLTEEEHPKVLALFEKKDRLFHAPRPRGTVLTIMDISEKFKDFKKIIGFEDATIWFSRKDPDSKHMDQLEVHFTSELNSKEKDRVEKAYSSTLEWKG